MGAIAGRVQGAGYPNEETPASLAIFPNLMLHPGAGGWFTQQNWSLTPQSHRWTAHYYYTEPLHMTESPAIDQDTALSRDSGMEDFIVMGDGKGSLWERGLLTVIIL